MVILDNHMTKPGWCCSNDDGNGFFGDRDFDPEMWVDGLTKMATLFKGVKNVVGMSLRNELRGPKQNVNDWYRYVRTTLCSGESDGSSCSRFISSSARARASSGSPASSSCLPSCSTASVVGSFSSPSSTRIALNCSRSKYSR